MIFTPTIKTSWEASHVPQRKNLPSTLSTQHKSRMHYLMPFLIESITFFRVPNNTSGTVLCFTILIYQGLTIRSKEKEPLGEGRCQPGTKIRNVQYHDNNFCHLQGFMIISLEELSQLTCKAHLTC